MYQAMKRMFLLSPLLLLLVSAAPATRPTAQEVDRLIVQVRRVEFTMKEGDSPLSFGDPTNIQLPADTKELSSIQTTTNATGPFESIAVIITDCPEQARPAERGFAAEAARSERGAAALWFANYFEASWSRKSAIPPPRARATDATPPLSP